MDPLQRLHTLTNLAHLLAEGPPPGVPRTLRDGSLTADAEAIRQVCSNPSTPHGQGAFPDMCTVQ